MNKELPTKNLDVMLTEYGIEMVWKKLLLALAKSYPDKTCNLIADSPEFNNIKPSPQNLLKDLTVGEVGILYEYSLAFVNPESRKNSGQYFTPDDVAEWMAGHSKKFSSGVWLDPCCGVGNLSFPLVELQDNPEEFLTESLILADMDSLALLIARTLLTLRFHKTNDNLFKDLASRMVETNFLTYADKLPDSIAALSPDFVIVNPPYAAHQDERFESSKARDLYAYFMELIIKSSKGYISVTPQSYTNGAKFIKLRELIIKHHNNVEIYNFDNVPDSVFRGIKFGSTNTNTANSVRASIIVAQKTTPNVKSFKITPLFRWRSSERERMWREISKHLSPFTPTKTIFPKHYKGLTKLYNEILTERWEPLSSLLSTVPTEYVLTIPTTPRYYITATKRPLSRASYTLIYFKNKADMDKLYVYLNSSILYWWWRLNDGGMTLSKNTLLSLPVEKALKHNAKFVSKLEQSELDNLVIKINAGKPQENVKHSEQLINEINTLLFKKETAVKLLATHKNSYL